MKHMIWKSLDIYNFKRYWIQQHPPSFFFFLVWSSAVTLTLGFDGLSYFLPSTNLFYSSYNIYSAIDTNNSYIPLFSLQLVSLREAPIY